MPDSRGDGRFLLAGVSAATLLPTLVLGLHAPLWLGLLGAGAAFAGVSLLAAPRRPFDGVDPARIGEGQIAVARAALSEAMPALDRLEAASKEIEDKGMRARTIAVAKIGREVVKDLEEQPRALPSVQRLLTYYLPRAAELAEAYHHMEERRVGADRRTSVADVFAKLEAAFTHFRDQIADQDLRALDIDIRLVDEALQEDIGEAPTKRDGSVTDARRPQP